MTLLPRLIRKPHFVDETGDPPRRMYHYQVVNTQSSSVAKALAEEDFGPVIATPYGILFRGPADCRSSAYNGFDVDLEYLPRPKDIGTWSWELDGGGVTENVTTSLEQVAKYPSTAPDSNNIIGLDEGQIKGAEVIRPAGKFVVTFTHEAGVMTLDYGQYLMNLVGYYNSKPWLKWAAGEVRFLRPRVADGSQVQASATYEFDIQKNRTNFAVGPISGITKLGWHVIDVRTKPKEIDSGGTKYPGRIPTAVYIHRVSDFIDFSQAFGFG